MNGINIKNIKKGSKLKADKKSSGSSLSEILNKDIQLFGGGLSDNWKEQFYGELELLLSSGLDIKSSLELISQEQDKPKHKLIVEGIMNDMINGMSLSNTLRSRKEFTPYEYYSILIGEESGSLSSILKELNFYYTKSIKQQRQIVSALSYPVIVISTAIGAVVFMLNFIVPMFADVFQRFGGELPGLTKMILTLSDNLKEHIIAVIGVAVALISSIYFVRKKDLFKKYWATATLYIPIVGPLIRKVYLARFCQIMSLLSGSKVPMLQASQMVRQMIGFYPIESSLIVVENDILNGEQLHQSLEKFSIYPKRMVSLIEVGERVNKLDEIFEKLAEQFANEVDHQTSMLSTILEPVLIIFLALVIGVILVAMYLPMFSLSNNLFS